MVIDIGSGLGIDEATAEMIILDHARLDEDLRASADDCDRAVAAIVTGEYAAASEELAKAPSSLRRDALRGELARVSGDSLAAVAIFSDLLRQSQPNGLRRASLLQHLGKAEYSAGDNGAAVEHLELALQLRKTHSAPADQIASSELMLVIAKRAFQNGP